MRPATGGQAMESLISDGFIAGVLDITTTELADRAGRRRLPGRSRPADGRRSQGHPAGRLRRRARHGQFRPLASVPERFRGRKLHVHNANVTLMRTSPEECTELGCEIATKLNAAQGPVSLFVPQGGISAISIVGGVFHDPVADQALFDSLKANLKEHVEVRWLDMNVNDARFAQAMAEKLERTRRDEQASSAVILPCGYRHQLTGLIAALARSFRPLNEQVARGEPRNF